MNQTSIDKCLTLLLELRAAIQKHGQWPALEEEVDHLISSLETEIRKSEFSSIEGNARLKEILSEVLWLISLLFKLFNG